MLQTQIIVAVSYGTQIQQIFENNLQVVNTIVHFTTILFCIYLFVVCSLRGVMSKVLNCSLKLMSSNSSFPFGIKV